MASLAGYGGAAGDEQRGLPDHRRQHPADHRAGVARGIDVGSVEHGVALATHRAARAGLGLGEQVHQPQRQAFGARSASSPKASFSSERSAAVDEVHIGGVGDACVDHRVSNGTCGGVDLRRAADFLGCEVGCCCSADDEPLVGVQPR